MMYTETTKFTYPDYNDGYNDDDYDEDPEEVSSSTYVRGMAHAFEVIGHNRFSQDLPVLIEYMATFARNTSPALEGKILGVKKLGEDKYFIALGHWAHVNGDNMTDESLQSFYQSLFHLMVPRSDRFPSQGILFQGIVERDEFTLITELDGQSLIANLVKETERTEEYLEEQRKHVAYYLNAERSNKTPRDIHRRESYDMHSSTFGSTPIEVLLQERRIIGY